MVWLALLTITQNASLLKAQIHFLPTTRKEKDILNKRFLQVIKRFNVEPKFPDLFSYSITRQEAKVY